MPQQGISIDIKGLKEFNKKMTDSNKKMSQGRKLHARIGTNLQKLIHKGFKSQGVAVTGRKWKNLERSTILARRQGSGGGNPQILQDSGTLIRSFAMEYEEKQARVGSALKYSKYHEFGAKYRSQKVITVFQLSTGERRVKKERYTRTPLPQRKMLPTKRIAQKIVDKTVDNFVKNTYKKVIK